VLRCCCLRWSNTLHCCTVLVLCINAIKETIVEVELTALQKQYYRALFEQNTQFLLRGAGKRRVADRPNLMNLAMELRK
jgi:hypothetical protein